MKSSFPLFASVILIAIFIALFNFSLPRIEDFLARKKVTELTHTLSHNFLLSLTGEEEQIIATLPCKGTCPTLTNIQSKYSNLFKNEIVTRALLLSENGEELFSGRKLDDKYISLINIAQTRGDAYLTERAKNNSSVDEKIIAVSKLPITNVNAPQKYVLILTDKQKIDFTAYRYIFASLTLLPALIIIFLFIKQYKRSASSENRLTTENLDFAKQIDDLKKENVQQSQFLANFTHELRTPLNSIIGFSGLLKDQTLGNLGNAEYVKYANDINNSGIHLLSLINDILDYSKSEVGKLKVNVTEVDVIKIIKQSLSIVAPRASESKVDMLQSFSADYFILRLDPKRLKQIILNLLSNSVKFTHEGGNVTVSVFPDIKGEKISIEVKDTGVGIAEKDIPTVMSLFGQVETDLNRKYEGTGIGLPFAKKLTQLMGGTFDLQSQVGVGTRITLSFPYDKKLNAEYAELFTKTSSEMSS